MEICLKSLHTDIMNGAYYVPKNICWCEGRGILSHILSKMWKTFFIFTFSIVFPLLHTMLCCCIDCTLFCYSAFENQHTSLFNIFHNDITINNVENTVFSCDVLVVSISNPCVQKWEYMRKFLFQLLTIWRKKQRECKYYYMTLISLQIFHIGVIRFSYPIDNACSIDWVTQC